MLGFEVLACLRGAAQVVGPRVVFEIFFPVFALRDFRERLFPESDLCRCYASRCEEAAPR